MMQHLNLPLLYAIADLDVFNSQSSQKKSSVEFLDYLEKLYLCGATLVQLRIKTGSDRQRIDLATATVKLTHRTSLRLAKKLWIIINDRLDICMLSNADGLHLGQNDISPTDARKFLGAEKIIGLSTHDLSQVEQANNEPVNYIGLGPVYLSKTKSGHAPLVGLSGINKSAAISKHPIVAIGGINLANAEETIKAGASSVAVINDLITATNLKQHVASYLEINQGIAKS